MIELLLTVVVIVALAILGFWLVDRVGAPDPLNWIFKGAVAIIAIWALLQQFGVALP